MATGMLWLMKDPKRPFAERVETAVAYYVQKYGRRPAVVHANVQDMDETAVTSVPVEASAYTLRHHLLVVAE